MIKRRIKLAILWGSLLLTACGGGGNSEKPPTPTNPEPLPEKVVSHAGENQTVTVGERVQLDGSASQVNHGEIARYQWQWVTRPDSSSSALDNADNVRASFIPDTPGEYLVQLTVTSKTDQQATANIAITVNATAVTPNETILVYTGANQEVKIGDQVQLDGSDSRVKGGEIANYQWRFTARPEGSQARLQEPNQARTSFTADVSGVFAVALTVTSQTGQQGTDSVEIRSTTATENSAPVAVIELDRPTITSGQTVTLSANDSRDADGDDLTYAWSLFLMPEDNRVTLTQPNQKTTTFTPEVAGEYQIKLVVSDGQVNSEPMLQPLRVIEEANSPPQIQKNNWPTTGVIHQELSLKATYKDAEDDAVFFDWSFQRRPAGSQAVMINRNTAEATFTPDVPGDYSIQVIANDQDASSDALVGVISVTNNLKPEIHINTQPDKSVGINTFVEFDASGSTDPEGTQLKYQWEITEKPLHALSSLINSKTATPTFTASTLGMYRIQLTVTDADDQFETQIFALEVKESLEVELSLGMYAIPSAGSSRKRLLNHPFTVDGQAFDTGSDGLFSKTITLFKPLADNRVTIKTQLEGMPPMVYQSEEIAEDKRSVAIRLLAQGLPSLMDVRIEPQRTSVKLCAEEKSPDMAQIRLELEKFDNTQFTFENTDVGDLPFDQVINFDTLPHPGESSQVGGSKTVKLFSYASYKISDLGGSHLFSRFIIYNAVPEAVFEPEVIKKIGGIKTTPIIWLCKP